MIVGFLIEFSNYEISPATTRRFNQPLKYHHVWYSLCRIPVLSLFFLLQSRFVINAIDFPCIETTVAR